MQDSVFKGSPARRVYDFSLSPDPALAVRFDWPARRFDAHGRGLRLVSEAVGSDSIPSPAKAALLLSSALAVGLAGAAIRADRRVGAGDSQCAEAAGDRCEV